MVAGTSGEWRQGWEACSGVLGLGQGAGETSPAARAILSGAAETLHELGTMLPVSLQPLLSPLRMRAALLQPLALRGSS